MSGKNFSVILDVVLTLQQRCRKVANHTDKSGDKHYHSKRQIIHIKINSLECVHNIFVTHSVKNEHNSSYNKSANCTLHRLFRGYVRAKFMLSAGGANEICARIGYPGRHKSHHYITYAVNSAHILQRYKTGYGKCNKTGHSDHNRKLVKRKLFVIRHIARKHKEHDDRCRKYSPYHTYLREPGQHRYDCRKKQAHSEVNGIFFAAADVKHFVNGHNSNKSHKNRKDYRVVKTKHGNAERNAHNRSKQPLFHLQTPPNRLLRDAKESRAFLSSFSSKSGHRVSVK